MKVYVHSSDMIFFLSLSIGKETKGFVHPCVRTFMQVGVRSDCAGDKIEKNEMGWACGAYG